MWKKWEVEQGLTMMISDDAIRRRNGDGRLRMDSESNRKKRASRIDSQRALRVQKRAAQLGSSYWTKKLMKVEEDDPDRWGHAGYKELYPEEFAESKSSESSDEPKKHKKKRKRSKRKKRQKKSSRSSVEPSSSRKKTKSRRKQRSRSPVRSQSRSTSSSRSYSRSRSRSQSRTRSYSRSRSRSDSRTRVSPRSRRRSPSSSSELSERLKSRTPSLPTTSPGPSKSESPRPSRARSPSPANPESSRSTSPTSSTSSEEELGSFYSALCKSGSNLSRRFQTICNGSNL